MIPLVLARDLSKRYGKRPILRNLDFSLGAGEVVALIGANGSGKTTLLRVLLGLIRASGGSVTWPATRGPRPPGTVDHFGGGHTLPPHVRASRWVRIVSRGDAGSERDLTPFGDQTTSFHESRPIRQLSRGSRQLLGLTTVLARKELSAVLLDEPWEGLDPDGARWLSETLERRKAEGCGFLVSSHRLHDLAGLCDRYAFLLDGRLTIRAAAEISKSGVRGEDLLRALDRMRRST